MNEKILSNPLKLDLPAPYSLGDCSRHEECHPEENTQTLTIYFDGSCTPNPGPVNYGVAVYLGKTCIFEAGYSTGKTGHNGIGEALGLFRALQLVETLRANPEMRTHKTRIVGDGQNILNGINHIWNLKSTPEKDILAEARELRKKLEPDYLEKIQSGRALDIPIEKIPDTVNLAHDPAKRGAS